MTRGLNRFSVLALAILLSVSIVGCESTDSQSQTTKAAATDDSVASTTAIAQTGKDQPAGYLKAKWDPIHFKPAIDKASDEECLACHQEVLDRRVRTASPAGVKAANVNAWYQTLNTYEGEQDTFHRRHLATPLAQKLMDMKCNTCHQGNDPRENTADSSATGDSDLIQRKAVDPEICLMCHGQFPSQIMGIPGPWPEHEATFQSCMTCHVAFRTNRHKVNFLKPEAIEAAGQADADACYGCHGGRSWYRISYPYPRHPWPGSGDAVPDWAKDRPTESEARFLVGLEAANTTPPSK